MNMKIDNEKIMYNEVYDFLNIIGNEYIEKIPAKLYEYIKSERMQDYNTNLNSEKNISSQISKDALTFIACLNLTYWASPEERKELAKIYIGNDKKEEAKLKEKYNLNNIFLENN